MELQTVVIDVDGVLTDGKVWYNSRGERTKAFHSRDIRAIRQLISHGYRVILLTQSTWPGIDDYLKRTGAEVVVSREKMVDPEWGAYIAIGDDTPDMTVLYNASVAFCPSDADPAVLEMKNVHLTHSRGGDAVIAEIVSKLSDWNKYAKAQ